MAILVIAEHDNVAIKAATLNTVAAALRIAACTSQPVHVMVAGYQAQQAAQAVSRIAGISQVLWADASHLADGLVENLEHTVLDWVRDPARHYSHILAPATAYGKSIAPRIAARLDVAQISEITAITAADTFERPIYAGNAIATVRSVDAVKVITVRTTAFDAVTATACEVPLVSIPVASAAGLSQCISRALTPMERPELAGASIVVSGGRGLGSGENYSRLLVPLADKLGAALGASRAAVDAGFVPNDYQVGQTGKIVAPQLYLAVGISGAIQHLAGMKDSRIIVAINKDPEAPIFSVADYGLTVDLFEAIPELTRLI